MDGVFEPFGDPVTRKGDENNQTNDLGTRATTCSSTAGWVGTGLILYVDCHQCNREPGAKGSCNDTTDQ